MTKAEQALSNALCMLAEIANGRRYSIREFNSRVVEMEQTLDPSLSDEAEAYGRFADRMRLPSEIEDRREGWKFRYPTSILWVNEGWWLFEAESLSAAIATAQERYPNDNPAMHLQVVGDDHRWHFADRYFAGEKR